MREKAEMRRPAKRPRREPRVRFLRVWGVGIRWGGDEGEGEGED